MGLWLAGGLGSHCVVVLEGEARGLGTPRKIPFPLPTASVCLLHFWFHLYLLPTHFCLNLSSRTSPSICPFPRPTAALHFPPSRSEYKAHFSSRNLRAFSVEPLLVYPTHYTGDDGYVSDTETSVVWNNEHVKTDWDRAKSQKMREQQALSREAKNSDVLQSPLDSAARDEL